MSDGSDATRSDGTPDNDALIPEPPVVSPVEREKVDERTTRHADVRAQWERTIADHETTGQSVREFCTERNIPEHSFYVWRKKLRQGDVPRRARRSGKAKTFMPVRITPGSMQSGPGVEIQFPSGYVLRASSDVDPAAVARLIAILDKK